MSEWGGTARDRPAPGAKTVDLGGGTVLHINDLSALKHHPAVKAAVEAKAKAAAAYANSIAVTKDATGTPLYYVRTRHGVVGVMPDSYKGVVDDAYHSTLLKVIAQDQGRT